MNTGPDSQDQDDEVPDASELLDFELIAKSEPDKGRGLWLWVVLVLVLAGGAGAGWMYLQDDGTDVASKDGVPLILAPKFKLKEPPVDPGGMKVPDRDKLIYDRMAGEGEPQDGTVERLLPPPETPIEPPKVLEAQPETAPAPAPEPVKPVAEAPQPAAPQPITPQPITPQATEQAQTPAQTPAPPPAPAPQPAAKPEPQPAPKPVPEPEPAPAKASDFQATGSAGQGYLVQLSAVRTEQAAKSEWARLLKAHPDVLGGLDSVIQRADLGDKGIFYRVRAGWFTSRAEAKAICDELATRNVGCLIAKP